MSRKRRNRNVEEKAEEKIEKENSKKCPECGFNIVTGNKEIYCDYCGLVIEENIVDHGPEWRSYDSEQAEKRIRVGPPMTYQIYDEGLSLPHSFSTLTNVGTKNTNEISLTFALSEIGRMASALRLPKNIKEDASLLYRKAMREKILKGRSIEAITSAIIYIICRQYGVPRTLEEIEKVSWVKEEYVYSAVKSLLEKLELKIPPVCSCDFVFRFCSLLDLSIKTRAKVLEIANRDFNGGMPTGIVGGIIYIVAKSNNEPRTKKEIAEIAGVSIPTILSRSEEISEQLQSDTLKIEN